MNAFSNAGELICIGKIIAPHGVYGEIKVYPLTFMPERFKKLKRIFLKNGDEVKTFHVKNVRDSGQGLFLTLKECPDRTAVEGFSGWQICIPDEEKAALPKDYYYHFQLIGLSVYEDGEMVGTVEDVYERGSQDCLSIRTCAGKMVLIPFHGQFVKDVNLPEKKILIKSIPGLLDG